MQNTFDICVQMRGIWRINKMSWKAEPVKRAMIYLISHRLSGTAVMTGMSKLKGLVCFRRMALEEKLVACQKYIYLFPSLGLKR